jgi:hypothetical protein
MNASSQDNPLARDVYELLESESLPQFASRAQEFWKKDWQPFEVLDVAVSILAQSLYRAAYPKHVPHSLMALSGCAQALSWLRLKDRKLLLSQALWYASHETHFPAYQWCPSGNDKAVPEAQADCIQACMSGDFKGFEDAAGPLFNSDGIFRTDWAPLLEYASADLFNLGHKFIYLVKTMQLCEVLTKSHDVSTLFYPACHYLALAPCSNAEKDKVDIYLLGKNIEKPPLKYSDAMPVVRPLVGSLVKGDSASTMEQIWGWLSSGVPPHIVSETLAVIAARLIIISSPKAWLGPIHTFNYTECVLWALPYLSYKQQVKMVVMNALCLEKAILRTEDISEELLAHRWKHPAHASVAPSEPGQFIAAIEAGDWLQAQNLTEHASASKLSWPEHFTQCVKIAARNDALLHFGHDVKYVASTISIFQRMRHPHRNTLMLALAKFLATCRKGTRLLDALKE